MNYVFLTVLAPASTRVSTVEIDSSTAAPAFVLGGRSSISAVSPLGKDQNDSAEIRKAMRAILTSLPPQSAADIARTNLEATAVPIIPTVAPVLNEPEPSRTDSMVLTNTEPSRSVKQIDMTAPNSTSIIDKQKSAKKLVDSHKLNPRKRSKSVEKSSSKSKRRKAEKQSSSSSDSEPSDSSSKSKSKSKRKKTATVTSVKQSRSTESPATAAATELSTKKLKNNREKREETAFIAAEIVSSNKPAFEAVIPQQPPENIVVPSPEVKESSLVTQSSPDVKESALVPQTPSQTVSSPVARLFSSANPFASYASPGFGLRKS